MPEEPLSAAELIAQQQDILARNGENQRKRQRRDELKRTLDTAEGQLAELTRRCEQLREDYRIASTDAADLLDQSTAELEENIRTQRSGPISTRRAPRRTRRSSPTSMPR